MEFNVADLIERIAGHIPEREALVCGDQRVSYGELNRRANLFGGYLLSVGLGKGDHIAIYGYNSIEWLVAMMGCFKVGAVPINVNFRYVEEELRYLLNDADAKALVYEAEFASKVAAVRASLPLLRHFVHLGPLHEAEGLADSLSFEQACAVNATARFPQHHADDHYLLYTGGTTGMPKGVVWRQGDAVMVMGGGIDMYTHEPFASPEQMADRCIAPNAFALKSMQLAPLMHGAAQWGVLRALFEGWTVVMTPLKHFDPHAVWDLVEREGVNVLLVTGDAMAKPMMDALLELKPDGSAYNTSSLLALASASAIFSPSLKDAYCELLPGVVITDNIGSSESGFTGSSVHEKHKAETNAGGPRVLPARHVVLLDDALNIMPPGDERIGRIARGGFIPLAYYKDPVKSAETFVTAADGQRYVIPGDMGRHNADGTITLLGRGSLCINTGGEKVFPEEVEMALKAHPDVHDCLVAATPDDRFGSCVTALIQLREGASAPALECLHAACASHIARYKLPRRVYFVGAIRRTPSGKADYAWAQQEAMRHYQSALACAVKIA